MERKKVLTTILVVLILLLLVGFIYWRNVNKVSEKDDKNIEIVTSFYPMYVIAENITEGANNIELVNMADVNVGCLHDYTLTTSDMKKIESADIFVINGLGMESFLDKVIEARNDLEIVDSSRNINNVIVDENINNPHIWTDLNNYILQIENISNALQEYDLNNAEIYKENTSKYIEKIKSLQKEYNEKLQDLNNKKAICLNEAFEYLGQDLGINMTSIRTDHEESSMSAEMLKNLIDKANNEEINMIIIDKNDNKSNAETIANETGAKIYELNSGLTGNLEKDAFVNQMKENYDILLNN